MENNNDQHPASSPRKTRSHRMKQMNTRERGTKEDAPSSDDETSLLDQKAALHRRRGRTRRTDSSGSRPKSSSLRRSAESRSRSLSTSSSSDNDSSILAAKQTILDRSTTSSRISRRRSSMSDSNNESDDSNFVLAGSKQRIARRRHRMRRRTASDGDSSSHDQRPDDQELGNSVAPQRPPDPPVTDIKQGPTIGSLACTIPLGGNTVEGDDHGKGIKDPNQNVLLQVEQPADSGGYTFECSAELAEHSRNPKHEVLLVEAVAEPHATSHRGMRASPWHVMAVLICLVTPLLGLAVLVAVGNLQQPQPNQGANPQSSPDMPTSPTMSPEVPPKLSTQPKLKVKNRDHLLELIDDFVLDVSQERSPALPPIGSWNVSAVTDMSFAFSGARNPIIRVVFDEDLSAWDVSRVVEMRGMFFQAHVFDRSVASWDVTQVTDMTSMFCFAVSFAQDLPDWQVSNVKWMNHMFAHAPKFNGNISHWPTHSLVDMRSMFENAKSFDQPLFWDVSKVQSLYGVFRISHTPLIDSILNLEEFDHMAFDGDISSWNTLSVTDMTFAFSSCQYFDQDLGRWNVSRVQSMRSLFRNANVFNHDLSMWDTSRVEDLSRTFKGAHAFNQDLSTWNLTSIADASSAFRFAHAFNQSLCGWWPYFSANRPDLNSTGRIGSSHPHMFWNTSCLDTHSPNLEAQTPSDTSFCHPC